MTSSGHLLPSNVEHGASVGLAGDPGGGLLAGDRGGGSGGEGPGPAAAGDSVCHHRVSKIIFSLIKFALCFYTEKFFKIS